MCTFKDWTLTFWVIGNYIGVASAAAAVAGAAAAAPPSNIYNSQAWLKIRWNNSQDTGYTLCL